MPNLDGGHYFFTALLPIDNHGIVEHGAFKSSPVHMVRDALEALPTYRSGARPVHPEAGGEAASADLVAAVPVAVGPQAVGSLVTLIKNRAR